MKPKDTSRYSTYRECLLVWEYEGRSLGEKGFRFLFVVLKLSILVDVHHFRFFGTVSHSSDELCQLTVHNGVFMADI